ncbi:DUF1620-domain-containing protein [Marasmius fiardii PR-910]|nr:DUF1620-domain-containing protein [Marasmius fiardii PR-910]
MYPTPWQTRALLLLLSLPLLFTSFTNALHESDVGIVDWHKPLIGFPSLASPATSPKFHRVGGRNTQSVILSATEGNVVAALNAVNGTVVWRYIFEPEDKIISIHKHGWIAAILSGPGGANLRVFNVLNGDLLFENQFHLPDSGLLTNPPNLGSYVAFGNDTMEIGTPDLFVLTNGRTITRFVGRNPQWTWNSEDQTSLVIYTHILLTSQAVYAIGLSKSFASYTLSITSLSPATGEVISSTLIPSSIGNGIEELLSLHSTTGEPFVAWLESNQIKSYGLVPELKAKTTSHRGTYFKFTDIGLTSHGYFMASQLDGSDQAMKLVGSGSGEVKVAWDFEGSAASQKQSASKYTGGFDKEGRPYIGRLYWSYSMGLASVELFAPHLADGKGLISGYSFRFDTGLHGTIEHVTMDTANPSPFQILGRLVVTTSAGTVQLWQQDGLQWSRDESLAEITATEFVELPETVMAGSTENREGFVERLKRQSVQAKNLPNYIIHFIKRFATGSYESATSSAAPAASPQGVQRDAFGFRQVIVSSTARGKVFGIDSSNGEILWSRLLGLGGKLSAEDGARVKPVKMFVVNAVGDVHVNAGSGPEVVVVAQRGSGLTPEEDVVIYHLNALTGEATKTAMRKPGPLRGAKIASGSVTDAYLLQSLEGKIVVVLDDKLKVHLYPDSPTAKSSFDAFIQGQSISVPLRVQDPSAAQHRVVGHQLVQTSDGAIAVPIWTFIPPDSEDIQAIIPATRGPVASLGKVLSNRTTLYKYLNPRLFVVLTAPHSTPPATSPTTTKTGSAGCGIYLLDGVKGSVVYHISVPTVGGTCDVKPVLTENWLVYHYYDEDYHGTEQTKGYRIVSVELYEDVLDLTPYERSFVYMHGITAIATTSTKFGISTKDIIVANDNHKIQSISRRFLDPRRPNKKPTTAESEEFLIQYDPVIPDDPRQTLSHNYPISRVQKIVTAPSLLESTSLVFAHGLDLFLTRVAPSKTFDVLSESFNKPQLVLTVAALGVGILFTKPAVNRKRLREKWYS